MSEFEVIWNEMEAARGLAGTGLLRRRVHAGSGFDLFIALEKPTNNRVLLLGLEDAAAVGELPALRSIEMRLRGDDPAGQAALELKLTNRAYDRLFSVLVRDLVDIVTGSTTEDEAMNGIVSRLEQWQRLLARSGPDGLGEEAQRGLYAELWFLGEHLVPVLGAERAVHAWTGPYGTNQDFQLPDLAIEVKSTVGRFPQRLAIASERQLDDAGLDILLLFHLSLDIRQGGGRTLGGLVDALRRTLGDVGLSRPALEDGLLAAGYLDAHRARYDRVGYTVRESNLFHVWQDFPRIVEAGLPAGVGDVRYSVAVAECSRFAVDDNYLREVVGGTSRGE